MEMGLEQRELVVAFVVEFLVEGTQLAVAFEDFVCMRPTKETTNCEFG